MVEQQRLRRQAARYSFREGKANDVARLNRIMALREHVSKQYTTDSEREQDETLRADNDLQEGLCYRVLGRVLISLRRCPVRPDTDRLCATAANVAMGHPQT